MHIPALNITTRPMLDDDEAFSFQVYASTRKAELAATRWSAAEKSAFLRQQFAAQHMHYQKHFADGTFEIVLWNEAPIGRLYLHRRTDEIRIVDIALLPQHCGKGIGTAILQEILSDATSSGLPVRIHVEKFNPALRLYRRLGFTEIGDQGVYLLMEYSETAG